MKRYGKDILKLILFLALGIFFVWFSVKDLSAKQWEEMWENIKEVMHDNRWIYLVLCMFIGFLSVLFRGLRSVLMIEPLGHKLSKINSYHAAMIGYLANLAFPRLGEVLRCTILQKYEKVPFQKSLGTVITERIIDVVIFGILLLIALGLESDKLFSIFADSNIMEKIMGMFSGTGKYIIIATMAAIVIFIYLFRKKISNLSVYQKITTILKGFWDGLVSIKDLKKPFLFVLYSLLIWVCYYLMFYVCTFAFPCLSVLGIDGVILASLSCVVVGTVGFIVAQGGLGAYPLLVAMVLSLYGISEESGLAIGWVVWTTETLMYVVLGVVSLLVISLEKDKAKTTKL